MIVEIQHKLNYDKVSTNINTFKSQQKKIRSEESEPNRIEFRIWISCLYLEVILEILFNIFYIPFFNLTLNILNKNLNKIIIIIIKLIYIIA